MMKKEKIQAYILRATDGISYEGYFQMMENELAAFQKIVGGHIEVVSLTDEIDVIVNEEGKIQGLSANRALIDDSNNVLDILVGDMVCVRHQESEFTDINVSDAEKINKYLKPLYCNMIIIDPDPSLPKYNEEDELSGKSNQ